MSEPYRKNFPVTDLRCKCRTCKGKEPNQCAEWALDKLQAIRDEFNAPIIISSAYRCVNHPEEAKKKSPGTHNQGIAFDAFIPWGADRARFIAIALKHGVKGLGIANSFIHIDFRDSYMSWTYS